MLFTELNDDGVRTIIDAVLALLTYLHFLSVWLSRDGPSKD